MNKKTFFKNEKKNIHICMCDTSTFQQKVTCVLCKSNAFVFLNTHDYN